MDAHQPTPDAAEPGLPAGQAPPPASEMAAEAALEELRGILARPDRQHSAAVEARVAELEHRTSDPSELVTAISPLMGDIIRRKIQDSRDEMIEALYPIIGQLIGRAVAEAIRDLARTIDARMRPSFSLGSALRRWRARRAGIPDAALALRDALPFRVAELFLVHRESGLLLQHLSNEPEQEEQADLVSGMLTAIRDFAQDAFGRGQEGQLDEIQYGTKRILIEATRHAYLAVVVDGIEPPGFRAALREQIIAIENAYANALVSYDGDASRFAPAEPELAALLARRSGAGRPEGAPALSAGQRRILVGLAALLLLCLLAACAGSVLVLRNALNRPATTVMIVITATPGPTSSAALSRTPTQLPTATVTPTASASAQPPIRTPSRTPTLTPTASATATAMPAPSPAARIIQAQVNIRGGPGLNYEVLELAQEGRVLSVVGRNATGSWWQVCCTQNGASGWVASALVQLEGTLLSVPVTTGE